MKVVVIGAGVLGSSIAVGLAKRGASVTVVDRQSPGSGTSATSFGWVNSNNKEPNSYYRLNLAGLQAHTRLAHDAADQHWLQQKGHLEFATEPDHKQRLQTRIIRLGELGYEVEKVSVDRARALVPDLIIPDDCDTIAFFPQEAHCYPSLYVSYLLHQSARLGVQMVLGKSVQHIGENRQGIQVSLDDGSVLAADHVVSAAGRWTNEVAQLVGIPPLMGEYEHPGDVTVGYLAVTNPVPTAVSRVVTSPHLNLRPDGGGRLLLQALDVDATADPNAVPGTDSGVARELMSRLRAVVKHSENAEICCLKVGQRAMPADGFSVIGTSSSVPRLYLVASHSGVTLAPFLGPSVAGEIFGETEPLFADFRPDRFTVQRSLETPATPRRPGEQ